ncbi:MAG TPA: YraN family protein [Cyclobacteriaceae bacterium]|nr:YraN family protein [Cyclobacteriaceae bacterium]
MMAQHNEIGRNSEKLASEWLQAQGYEFIEANYRYKHAEIDLIMKHNGILVFVEVKFRTGTGYGYVEEFVDYKKRQLIIRAADNYIHATDWHKDIRFDILGVYRDSRGNMAFKHFPDAFY